MQRRQRTTGIAVDPARVREARLAAGLSLADIAGTVVSRTQVHFVERGRSRPSRRVLERIAKQTGKPVAYFLVSEPDSLAPVNLEESIPAQLRTLASRVKRLAASRQLAKSERQSLELLALTLRHGSLITSALSHKPLGATPAKRKPAQGSTAGR